MLLLEATDQLIQLMVPGRIGSSAAKFLAVLDAGLAYQFNSRT